MTAVLQQARSVVVLTLLLVSVGCNFGLKPKSAAIPVPDPPKPILAKKIPPVIKSPSEMPPPPPIEAKVPEVQPEVTKVIAEQSGQSKLPKPNKRKVVAKKNPVLAAPATEPAVVGPQVETAPIPKLVEIMTDEQRVVMLKACNQALARARQSLNRLKSSQLSHEQSESVERIRTFISQAEQARQADPQTARQLAERADLLSQDLLRIVR